MSENKKNSYYYDEDETYVPLNLDEVKTLSEANANDTTNSQKSRNNPGYNIYILISFISTFLILLSFITLFFSKVVLNYSPHYPQFYKPKSITLNLIEYFGILNIIFYSHILIASFIIPLVVIYKSRCKGLHILLGFLLILMFFVIVITPSGIEKYYNYQNPQEAFIFDGFSFNGAFWFNIIFIIVSLILQFISFKLSVDKK